MLELFVEIVPGFYDELADLLTMLGEFFAGGVLVAFIFWTIGFVVGEVFAILVRDVIGGR